MCVSGCMMPKWSKTRQQAMALPALLPAYKKEDEG